MAGQLDVARPPMNRLDRSIAIRRALKLLALASVLGLTAPIGAHVGSPTVFYEGQAGPYSARITVRPPEVIPGLAAISVRVSTAGVRRVAALPIRWNTG